MEGSLDHSQSFLIDGKEFALPVEGNLYEVLGQNQTRPDGFCYHPLLKNSRSCLLCQVYDERRGKVVLACQVQPGEGDRFLTSHQSLRAAKEEVEDLYYSGHEFSCSRCSHHRRCYLKAVFPQPLEQKTIEHKESLPTIPLSENLSVNFSQCIHCSLCTDFEAEHSSQPILLASEKHPQVVGHFDHNYGVNLIDLCPTGCFQLVSETNFSTNYIEKDFCRGCDRLCEVEVLYDITQSNRKGLRARAPLGSAHLVCDDVNLQWQERLKIPLNRALKKEGTTWRPYEGIETDGPWHIMVPSNLPHEMWKLLDDWVSLNPATSFEFYEWPDRREQKGLLRAQRHFLQEERLKFEERGFVKDANQKQQVALISPEWIGDEKVWQDVLERVQNFSRKVFIGPAMNFDLYEKMDELQPVPAYDLMSWRGRNYQNELHSKVGQTTSVQLFKEVNKK